MKYFQKFTYFPLPQLSSATTLIKFLIKEFQCVIELKNILLLTFYYVAGRVISFIWTYIFWIKRLHIHHTVESHGTKSFSLNKSLNLPCWHAIDHGSPTPWLRPITGRWPIRNRAAEAAGDCAHTQLHLHKRVCTCMQLQVCPPLVQMELHTCAQLLLKHNHSLSLPPTPHRSAKPERLGIAAVDHASSVWIYNLTTSGISHS